MVRISGGFHSAFDDGTPYFPFGTTAYSWAQQAEPMREQTLATLRTAGFNKLRTLVEEAAEGIDPAPFEWPWRGMGMGNQGLRRIATLTDGCCHVPVVSLINHIL